jgi:S-DNA-T family DNA segregation ATPase FtsK/SpoIIIE
VILATQRPNNDSVPASVSGLIISRFCLMVPGQIENDMVLGTSAYRNGYKATTLRPKVDAGFGWLKGSEDGIPQVVHAYYLNLKATARIVDRARAIREAAGVLSGVALGLDDSEAPRSFLADVLQVFGADDKLWSPTIADRLAGQIPGAYEGITAEAVASQLRNAGVAVKDVRESGGPNRKGCERAAVEAVAANPGG